MDLYIVTEDLGDGDIALRYFSSSKKALEYMEKNGDWCSHESNPHHLTIPDDPTFLFNDGE